MVIHNRQYLFMGLMIIFAGLLVACQSTSSLATPSAPGISVGITGDTCPNVEVQIGQQVTWTNQDTQEHIVRDKPTEGNAQFDSGTLQPGDSFAFTFVQAGSYVYECSEDGSTTGMITVQQ